MKRTPQTTSEWQARSEPRARSDPRATLPMRPWRWAPAAALAIGTLFATPSAHAGAWVRDPGKFYIKVGVGAFAGQESEAAALESFSYQSKEASLYGEVGLPWGLGITAYLPFVEGTNELATVRYVNRSAGDSELALSKRILSDKIALSATAIARVPLYGDRADERAASFGPFATRFPDPGDGTPDLDGRVDIGTGLKLGTWGGWVQGGGGYRHRFAELVDGLIWNVQVGVQPRWGGKDRGWIGLETGGLKNVVEDELTKEHVRVGAFAAAAVAQGVSIEASGGWIPVAQVSRTGTSVGVGVSWTR